MLLQQDYIAYMQHALGKTPDARHKLTDTFNAAGRALVTAHPWSWRLKGPVTLTPVAGQGFIVLPKDFSQVVTIFIPSGGAIQRVEQTTLQNIANIRALATSYIGTGLIYIYFPSWTRQGTNKEAGPVNRAELAPVPAATGTPSFSMFYDATWTEIDADDVTAQPDIPLEFEHALKLICREYATNLEEGVPSLDGTVAGEEIKRLIDEDSRRQFNYGRMTGGADARMSTNVAVRRVVGLAQL